ncbi:unnamed protein product [Blepharisma stoltei]|uniref:Single-stranded DNA binding protein Ssb-like OB fold domain-containing protein n=1 Tax=Blepharisma stoltei TaxID=1481888 RepID=A0AAU9IWN3_9CILI|nr:unnamed protein product [Blepharisma stoltei]
MSRPKFTKIDEMIPGTRINCICKIIRGIMSASTVRSDGTKVSFAEVEVGDESGAIRLRLFNNQCDLAKENQSIIIRDGIVAITGDLLRIEIDNYSTIEASPISYTKQINTINLRVNSKI